MEIFDISLTLREGIAVWPGDPEFQSRPVLQVSKGDSSNVSAIYMGTHTGTHIDAPLHVDSAGADVSDIPLQSLIGPVRVMDLSAENGIRATDLASMDWQGVTRVLFRTRAGSRSEPAFDPYFMGLEEQASKFLVRKGILLVGIDTPSVDPLDSADLRSHKILLRNRIVILENAQLSGVSPGDYNLVCLPLRIAGADGSPVRAVLSRE